jgi:hypothetical protein
LDPKGRKRPLSFSLSHRANEALVRVNEVYRRENSQEYFKGQNGWVVFYCHEIPVLEYVCEHQELQEYGPT